MEKLELSQLMYPTMREELIDYLKGLSDWDYQYENWVLRKFNPKIQDELDLAIHFLYDDTDLARDSDSWIGVILLNKNEANAIKILTSKLDFIFGKYGLKLTDEEYINKLEWNDVLAAAKQCLEIMGVSSNRPNQNE